MVLVDNLLARRFFPEQSALGRTITIPHWGADRNVSAEVVGIVGHVDHYGLDGSVGEKPQIYFSFYQLPDDAMRVFRSEISVVVRARVSTDSGLMPAVRNALHEVNGDQPIYNVRTMPELVSRSMGRQRFPMLLLVAFAVLALLFAFVGIFGVISYSTARRVTRGLSASATIAPHGDLDSDVVPEAAPPPNAPARVVTAFRLAAGCRRARCGSGAARKTRQPRRVQVAPLLHRERERKTGRGFF